MGPPGERGEPGPPGEIGPPGPAAITAVYAAELPFDGDVKLSDLGFITNILELGIPAGAYVISATAAVENRGDTAADVVVWISSVPPPLRFVGPRSTQVTLPPGAVATVSLGPCAAEVSAARVVGTLAGATESGADVWITESTRLLNRTGGTGLTAMGTGPAADA